MKTLWLIGGAMGAGKTTVCQRLKKMLPACVFFDGDWAWDADPFIVTEETKALVVDNIAHVLGNFLSCSAYENVVFCWVMHEQAIINDLLSRLPLEGCRVRVFSLVLREDALIDRLRRDIDGGLRTEDVIERSLARLPLYAALNTEKIDVSDLTAEEAAAQIAAAIT